MPRKKKDEKKPPKVVSNGKAIKPVKKKLVSSAGDKKKTLKKNSATIKPKKTKILSATIPKPRGSKTVKKLKNNLDASDPLINHSFKVLPRQGETQLVAFIRDPQCVFTYWEVTPERLEKVKKELKEEFKNSYMVLRLLSVESNGDRILVDEIRIEPGQMNRYLELKREGIEYVLELGQKTLSGRLIVYAQSHLISTDSKTGAGWSREDSKQSLTQNMPPELLEYYQEQGYDFMSPAVTEKISSAENLKRLRWINRASFF